MRPPWRRSHHARPMTPTPRSRDRFRLGVSTVTALVAAGSLTAVGWFAGAAAREQEVKQAHDDAARRRCRRQGGAREGDVRRRGRHRRSPRPPPRRVILRPPPARATVVHTQYVHAATAPVTVGGTTVDLTRGPAAPAAPTARRRTPRPRRRLPRRPRRPRPRPRARVVPCRRRPSARLGTYVFVRHPRRPRARGCAPADRGRAQPTSTARAAGSAPTPTCRAPTPRPGTGPMSTRCSSRPSTSPSTPPASPRASSIRCWVATWSPWGYDRDFGSTGRHRPTPPRPRPRPRLLGLIGHRRRRDPGPRRHGARPRRHRQGLRRRPRRGDPHRRAGRQPRWSASAVISRWLTSRWGTVGGGPSPSARASPAGTVWLEGGGLATSSTRRAALAPRRHVVPPPARPAYRCSGPRGLDHGELSGWQRGRGQHGQHGSDRARRRTHPPGSPRTMSPPAWSPRDGSVVHIGGWPCGEEDAA